MRYFISLIIALIFAALDWLALHDIINGGEDLIAEYAILVISLAVYAGLAFMLFLKKPARELAREVK